MKKPKDVSAEAKPKTGRSIDFDRLLGILTILVLIGLAGFIGFLIGGVGTALKIPRIADFTHKTTMAIAAAYNKYENDQTDQFWYQERLPLPASGNPIVTYDAADAWNGLNLVVSTYEEGASLITMDGKPVHKWSLRFLDAWKNPPQIPEFDKQTREYWSDKTYWRRAHLYPNGDLLIVFESPYRTPYGVGLAKIDRNSRLLWKLPINAHHDTAVAPNGQIYALTHTIKSTGYNRLSGLKPPIIDDKVTLISPDGKIEKNISIISAFLNSDFAPMLDLISKNTSGDVTHLNTVQFIDEQKAAKFPFAKAGDLLISMREMSTVAVLDPHTGKITWAATGMWRHQHEPVLLDNGRMLIYDNQGLGGITGPARALEIDPVTLSRTWSYPGPKDEPIFNRYQGSLQRLPNGNTLIVESINGRAIEVNRSGRIVWEYRSPHRRTVGATHQVAFMPDLVRVDRASLNFLGQ